MQRTWAAAAPAPSGPRLTAAMYEPNKPLRPHVNIPREMMRLMSRSTYGREGWGREEEIRRSTASDRSEGQRDRTRLSSLLLLHNGI